MTAEQVAAAASAIAVGVSIWAALAAKSASNAQHAVQERLLKLEHARERDRIVETRSAALLATLTRDPRSGTLRVHNAGRSEARHVEIRVNEVPLDKAELFHGATQPLRVLGPNADAVFGMMTYDAMPRNWLVELRWEDDSGEPGQWRSELTFEW